MSNGCDLLTSELCLHIKETEFGGFHIDEVEQLAIKRILGSDIAMYCDKLPLFFLKYNYSHTQSTDIFWGVIYSYVVYHFDEYYINHVTKANMVG